MKLSDNWKVFWSHLPRNKPAFFFAVFFVVYGFLNISPLWWLKCVFGPFGLYVEYEAQWVWGYAMALKKRQKNDKKKTWGYWAAFNIIYILLLALPTGAGLFITEIATQEAKTEIVDTVNDNRQAYIINLQEQIRTKNNDLTTEFNKYGGNGANYKTMQKDLNQLNADLKEAINAPQTVSSDSVTVVKKDMFTNVADLTGIPKQWIIGLMLTASLLMVYVGLWKKPMVVKLEEEAKSGDPEEQKFEMKSDSKPEPERPLPKTVKVVKRELKPEKFETPKTPDVSFIYPPINVSSPVLTKPLPIIQNNPVTFSENENTNVIESVKAQNDETLTESNHVKLMQELELTTDDIPDMIKFVEGLYDGTTDNDIGKLGAPLKGVAATSEKIGVPFRRCNDYKKFLNEIGAVNTTNGIPSRGLWPKRKIVDFINENVKGE